MSSRILLRCLNSQIVRSICTGNTRLNVLPPSRAKPKSRGLMTWRSAGIATAIGGGLLGFMFYVKKQKEETIDKERKRMLGKTSIGGQFELVDSEGKLRTSQEFIGKWVLIYFGFTHCPDICPDEMEKMSTVIDIIEKKKNAPPLQALFISVDPTRDTPPVVGNYVKEFSSKLLGLTGSPEQVEKACKAYRVYFSAGPKDLDMDYIVDHTIIMYLVDPDGNFVDYYGQLKTAEDVSNSINFHITKYEMANKKGWF